MHYLENTTLKDTFFFLKDYDADALDANSYIPKFGTKVNKTIKKIKE